MKKALGNGNSSRHRSVTASNTYPAMSTCSRDEILQAVQAGTHLTGNYEGALLDVAQQLGMKVEEVRAVVEAGAA